MHERTYICFSVQAIVGANADAAGTIDINDGIMREQGQIHGHKLLLEGQNAKASRTDVPMDRLTDQRTDRNTLF